MGVEAQPRPAVLGVEAWPRPGCRVLRPDPDLGVGLARTWVLGVWASTRAPTPSRVARPKVSALFTPNRPSNKGFGMSATPKFSKSALRAARYAEVCDLIGWIPFAAWLYRGVGTRARAARLRKNVTITVGVGCWAAPRGWVLEVLGCPKRLGVGCWREAPTPASGA